jgi:hypothetical protein
VRDLKALILGALAAGVLAYTSAAALAVAAQAGGRPLTLGLGPLLAVSVEYEGSGAITTFGAGLIVLAFVGGLLNVGAARLVRRGAVRQRRGIE